MMTDEDRRRIANQLDELALAVRGGRPMYVTIRNERPEPWIDRVGRLKKPQAITTIEITWNDD